MTATSTTDRPRPARAGQDAWPPRLAPRRYPRQPAGPGRGPARRRRGARTRAAPALRRLRRRARVGPGRAAGAGRAWRAGRHAGGRGRGHHHAGRRRLQRAARAAPALQRVGAVARAAGRRTRAAAVRPHPGRQAVRRRLDGARHAQARPHHHAADAPGRPLPPERPQVLLDGHTVRRLRLHRRHRRAGPARHRDPAAGPTGPGNRR